MTRQRYSKEITSAPTANITLNNVGTGTGTVVANPGTASNFNVKSINSSDNTVTITNNVSDIDLSVNIGAGEFQVLNSAPFAVAVSTGVGATLGPYFTISETGSYLIHITASLNISAPANVDEIKMNVNINGTDDLFPTNFGIKAAGLAGIDLQQTVISGSTVANLTAGDDIYWRYFFQTNANGGCTFTIDGTPTQSGLTISAVRLS